MISSRWFCIMSAIRGLKHLGTFDTAEEAYAAYVEAKRSLHPGCTI
jgi:hypothetical protein